MITPQTESKELAQKLGIPALFFKREDLHPYGSHKGRSIPMMIDEKVKLGKKHFALSSSGNAALSAIRHIQKKNREGLDLSLSVITGENIDKEKQEMLEREVSDSRISIITSKRPLQSLFELIKGEKVESLRQSNDPLALVGYETLAREILETKNLDAIFIGSSSGTTAQAIGEYVIKTGSKARIFVVQTSEVSTLIQNEPSTKEISLAHAIVDKVGHRKNAVQHIIEQTHGAGVIASNKDIARAQTVLKETAHIDTTANGALGFAGLLATLDQGTVFNGSVVCIITGK